MGNLVFGSGAEPGRASKARGGLTESPMERDYDATESDGERYSMTTRMAGDGDVYVKLNMYLILCFDKLLLQPHCRLLKYQCDVNS